MTAALAAELLGILLEKIAAKVTWTGVDWSGRSRAANVLIPAEK